MERGVGSGKEARRGAAGKEGVAIVCGPSGEAWPWRGGVARTSDLHDMN